MKITVAIPIYNAERHLNVTLDSLINQTMDSNDYEVICVNDVSTDNSVKVVETYMEKQNNIKLINRTENSGGPMLPRNDAINEAKGEYILFLDNDDFIGEETLERFYKSAKEYNSDVIFGKYIGVNGRVVPQSMFKYGNLPNAEILDHNLVFSLAPHKMFKVDLIREHNIRFHKEAVVGEDQLFVMQCFVKAKVITVLSDYEYYYVVKRGDENLSLKYFPAKNFFYSFNNIMKTIEESDLSSLYKTKLSAAFLNRFLHASRLRGHIFSNLLTTEQKIDWLNETKKFIDNHVSDELINLLPSRFHYFVLIARENDLQKLLMVHKRMESVSPNQITRVENGWIYARFKNTKKYLAYDEEHTVNHVNKSDVFVDNIVLDETHCEISGQFYQSLLINMNVNNELVLVHRKSGIEKRVVDNLVSNSGQFKFKFNYQEFVIDENSVGPWDVFIEGTIGGYRKRRRLGQARRTDLVKRVNMDHKGILPRLTNSTKEEVNTEKEISFDHVLSFGKKYIVKAYFTKGHDNLSFDIKLNK
ncbi:glycosyltransferase [Oceanobacillus bengalensis]|uniref:Glycosyltransferase family 2 protein n=1 Tax=Oceanobacillus bengalensis TaxID=1435466 RepID=A0A494Z0D2_9BACI|nr:glycosyltransferase [Oceanobacillus bengalensis]RKQ15735.1 glycosyltransferase family 2 protein [Oceanobacillus bengalensis]